MSLIHICPGIWPNEVVFSKLSERRKLLTRLGQDSNDGPHTIWLSTEK